MHCKVPVQIRGKSYVTSAYRNPPTQIMQNAIKRNFPVMLKDYNYSNYVPSKVNFPIISKGLIR